MAHFHQISFENFRVFQEETSFDLSPITLLTGTNSSGKSSVVKGLNLFFENIKNHQDLNLLDFNIGEHELGSFEKVINHKAGTETIKLAFTFRFKDAFINAMGEGSNFSFTLPVGK